MLRDVPPARRSMRSPLSLRSSAATRAFKSWTSCSIVIASLPLWRSGFGIWPVWQPPCQRQWQRQILPIELTRRPQGFAGVAALERAACGGDGKRCWPGDRSAEQRFAPFLSKSCSGPANPMSRPRFPGSKPRLLPRRDARRRWDRHGVLRRRLLCHNDISSPQRRGGRRTGRSRQWLLRGLRLVPDPALFQQSGNHRRTRCNAQFRERATQMRAHRPTAYVENAGDGLVGVTFGNHANDLLLSRAQRDKRRHGGRHPDEHVAHSVDIRVDNDLFVSTLSLLLHGRTFARDLPDQLSNQIVNLLALPAFGKSLCLAICRYRCKHGHPCSPNRWRIKWATTPYSNFFSTGQECLRLFFAAGLQDIIVRI